MRTHSRLVLAAALSLLLAASLPAQTPLTNTFTYQGELAQAGVPATGVYDFQFRLLDSNGIQVGDTLCSDNVTVTSGRFTVSLDFGAVFNGQRRFLEISVRPDMGRCSLPIGYTVLSPQQELTATPNAAFSLSAGAAAMALNAASLNGQAPSFYQNAANLTGTLPDARLSSNVARLDGNQTFSGLLNFTNPANTFTGSGSGLTNLNGASVSAGTLGRSSLTSDVQTGLGVTTTELVTASSVATGTNPSFVTVSGSYAYVLTGLSTLQIFNISNPVLPSLVGSVATDGSPTSMAVSGSYAYVVNVGANTLQVFNISNPAAPTSVASISTLPNSGLSPYAIAVSGSYAYVLTFNNDKLQVFNISNPAAPSLAASVSTGANSFSLAISGSYAYVANSSSSTLQVFNISNPASPTVVGSASTGSYPRAVAISGQYAYVANYVAKTMQVFNLSNPVAPALVGSVATGDFPTSVAISGSTAYVANSGSNTVQVIDISSPTAPTTAGLILTGAYPISVAALPTGACVVNNYASTLQTMVNAPRLRFSSILAASTLTGVDGSGLQYLNAANLLGSVPAASLTSVPAANLTGTFPAGISIPAANLTEVPAGILTGAIPASVAVPAAALTGSIPPASLTNVPAASLTGAIPAQALPATSWENVSLGTNAISSAAFVPINGTSQAINTRAGTAVVNWSTTASSTAGTTFLLRVRAVTNAVTRTGASSYFTFHQSNVDSTISGNAIVNIPSDGVTTFTLDVRRISGPGTYQTDANDSLTGTILNIGN